MELSTHRAARGGGRLSRRTLLARAAAAGVTPALAGIGLIGCGGNNSSSAGSTSGSSSSGATGTAAGAAVTKVASTAQAKPGGTLKSSISFDVDTLDPITTKSFKTSVLAAYTYGRLLKFKTGKGQFADGSVEGDVAAKWEQPDETTTILHLRDGLKFDQRPPTSGRVLTAEDAVLSWQKYAAASAYKSDLSHAASDDASVTAFTATDDKTIQIKTAFADAMLLPVLAFAFDLWILPKEGLSGGFDPNTEMRGTGPWTLEKYTPSVGFSLKKNPNYYGAPQYPLADGIELPIITDTAQAESQFKAKNVWFGRDLIPATDMLSIYNAVKGTRIDLQPPAASGPTISFSWRTTQPFKDVRVRQAISMLVDRDTFVEVFYDLKNFLSAGIKMRGYWNAPYGAGYGPFWMDPKDSSFGDSAKYLKYNVDEAKKLLTAAGFPNGFETTLTFVAGPTYGRDWPQRAEALASMLAKGGVKANLNAIDYTSVWIPQYLRQQGDWDGMAMYPNGTRADPGQWMQVFLSSGGANNQVAKNFPQLDALIDKQRKELDRNKRIDIFHDIQRYCTDQMVVVPQGGTTESPSMSWQGVHGPEEYSVWQGDTYSEGLELYPYYWIDDSLRS